MNNDYDMLNNIINLICILWILLKVDIYDTTEHSYILLFTSSIIFKLHAMTYMPDEYFNALAAIAYLLFYVLNERIAI
jgi:hypothetical protein